jgi:hypothetical protein|uniref:RidA family protein n=1 Tax=Daejeonella sp. TaxID=2805397 RepID=UPI00404B4ABB
MDILQNVNSLKIDLENLPIPGGSYTAVNIRSNIAYVAIQFPIEDGQLKYAGHLGNQISREKGYEAAGICARNIIGQIQKFIGFENIEGLNHLDIYFQKTGMMARLLQTELLTSLMRRSEQPENIAVQ